MAEDAALQDKINELEDQVKYLLSTVNFQKNELKQLKTLLEVIKESESKYRFLTENSNDVIWMMDMGLNFTYISRSTEKLFGYKIDERVKVSMDKIVTQKSYQKIILVLSQIIAKTRTGEKSDPVILELEGIHKDGHSFWFEIKAATILNDKGQPIGIHGISREITERKTAEIELNARNEEIEIQNEDLRILNKELARNLDEIQKMNEKVIESEEKFRTIIENIPIPLFIKDMDSNYLFANKILLNYLKIDSAVGKTDFDLYPKEMAQKYREDDLIVIKSNQVEVFEESFITAGKEHFVIATKMPFKKANGEVIGLIGTFIDITDRIKVEEDLIKAKEKAEESDRLKSAFLSNMSHEIRTPLNGITGFAEMLRKPNLTDEKKNYYVNIINSSSSQLLSIINDIIDISRIEAGQITINKDVIHIDNMIDGILSFLKHETTKKNIALKFDASKKNVQINSDSVKLRQILNNLIMNAIKFTDEGYVQIGYQIKEHNIEFSVRDTGIGIDKDSQSIIFERFRQLDTSFSRKYGGTGLGLSITKAYVEALGGKIWVDSEINKGTTFYFSLPYFNSMNTRDGNIYHQVSSDYIWKNKVILLVEDEEINKIFFKDLLSETKVTLLYADNGQQAVDIIRENKPVDLILMDVIMPVMDGLQATRLIKKIKAEIPVIAQTALAFTDEKIRIMEAGCDDYIEKPIIKDLLFELIDRYLKKSNS